jgi:hypothetical protein
MSQQIRKNLLIICEGTETEPNYFEDLRDIAMELKLPYRIKIRPKPIRERKEEEKATQQKAREGGRLRQIKQTKQQIDEPIIPENYIAQPIRYVWEAQQGLKDGTYDEAWAVFDKDGHTEHEQAFQLAEQEIEGKKVRIAFSAISFETWILLHFEYCNNDFIKSQCRTQKESHECGQEIHEKDCRGENCITGYIKVKGYIPKNMDVKHIRYTTLKKMTPVAIRNALKLRKELVATINEHPIYALNPYTTVDKLVFKLLQLQYDYKWIDNDKLTLYGLNVNIQRTENSLNLVIHNSRRTSFIIQPEHFHLVNIYGERKPFLNRKLLDPDEVFNFLINLSSIADFDAVYLSFSINSLGEGITELPIE